MGDVTSATDVSFIASMPIISSTSAPVARTFVLDPTNIAAMIGIAAISISPYQRNAGRWVVSRYGHRQYQLPFSQETCATTHAIVTTPSVMVTAGFSQVA